MECPLCLRRIHFLIRNYLSYFDPIMNQSLVQISLLVDDYDRAIRYYCDTLKFQLLEDTVLSPEKRWVVVKPAGEGACRILLARAANEEQQGRIGNQTGGRVFLFLHTDDLMRDWENLNHHGVRIVRPPAQEAFGKVLVFEDLYGNLWDLIEPVKI